MNSRKKRALKKKFKQTGCLTVRLIAVEGGKYIYRPLWQPENWDFNIVITTVEEATPGKIVKAQDATLEHRVTLKEFKEHYVPKFTYEAGGGATYLPDC